MKSQEKEGSSNATAGLFGTVVPGAGPGPDLKPRSVDDLFIRNIPECDAGLQHNIALQEILLFVLF